MFGLSLLLAAASMTSQFSDIGRGDCRIMIPGEVCAGVGGYTVIKPKGLDALYLVVTDDKGFETALGAQGFQAHHTKMEWRLANGKPFAVILRVFGPTKRDETYLIRGLKGYEAVRGAVDAKLEKNANERARKLADFAYLQVNELRKRPKKMPNP